MKLNTDNRINKAKEVTKDELIDKIKESDPVRFDQMLIEEEERKTYFFVKYNSVAYSRKPKTLDFPLFKDLVNDFERNIDRSGDVKVLSDNTIINKVKNKGKNPKDTSKYLGKNLVFSDLKIETESGKVKVNQPIYYIPSETSRCKCNTCDGDMYTTCIETECRGQHIYDCNKCNTRGTVDCGDCKGQGEKKCTTCSGTGSIKCKGYVGPGSGGPASNQVYSCSNGKNTCSQCYGKKCSSCNYTGKATCPTCHGAGKNTCSKKFNSNFGVGKLWDSVTDVNFCEGSGKISCKTCDATGQITCNKCKGDGRIVCKTCYGDNIYNRYGKVDCVTCETAGELASISYIETEIKSDNLELICTDGVEIEAPNFGVDTIKKHSNKNYETVLTYKNLNGETSENYDEYSSFASSNAMLKVGINKDSYPKLLVEELFTEGVPCATINYNHILTATYHDVSVLSIDKENEILFHSDPRAVAEESETFKQKLNELCSKAFSVKSYKDKIDRKHEMFLMIHMAKADGIVEEREKKYLAQNITGLHGFTVKEKAELFALMSANTLPPILPTNAYFSTKERAEEARKKIVELVAKADGEYDPQEKTKMEEINNAIELGYKAKPSALGRFFKTWQISGAIFLAIISISLSLYYTLIVYPLKKAEAEHSRLLLDKQKLEYFLSSEKNKTFSSNDTIHDIYEAKEILNNLVHNSELFFINDKKEISYNDYWKYEYDKLKPLLLQYESTHKEKEIDNAVSDSSNSDQIEYTEAQDDLMVEAFAEKVYFYDNPNAESITKSYFVKGQQAKLLGAAGEFSKVRFEYNGKVTEKFVLTYQISEIYTSSPTESEEGLDPEYQESEYQGE